MSDTSVQSRAPESDFRLMAALVYGLMLFGIFNGFTAIVGVIVAYVKRGDARSTIYESHFQNAITVFWVGVFCAILFVLGAGAGIFGLFAAMGTDFWASHFHHWHDMNGNANWNTTDWHGHHHWHWAWHDGLPFNVSPDYWPMVGFLPLVHIGALIFGVWFIYRMLRGLIHALDSKAY